MFRQQQLVPISIADLEHNAHITLALNALDYYRSGANDMQTLKDNQDAFSRYRQICQLLLTYFPAQVESSLSAIVGLQDILTSSILTLFYVLINRHPIRIRLRPRILRDVSKVDTQTTLLGHTVGSPICIAPTAMQRLANDAGEKATARGIKTALFCGS